LSLLRVLDGRWAVVRLDPERGLPAWFTLGAPFSAAVRREGELSLVCPEDAVPADVLAELDWAALEVAGPMDHALTGILAGIAAPLGVAGVPVFALATYDTDVVLVPAARLADARDALREAGHEVD
jgi:hypothetical protein